MDEQMFKVSSNFVLWSSLSPKCPAPEYVAVRAFEPSRISWLSSFFEMSAETSDGEAPATHLHFGLPY